MSAGSNIFVIGAILLLLIIGVQAVLSAKKRIAFGYIMPALFLILAGYNLYKSLFVYNPYPTMQEGMLMTFGMIGFGISAVTLVICRIIRKHNEGNK